MDKKPSGQNRKAMVLSASVIACGRHTGKGLKTGCLRTQPPFLIPQSPMTRKGAMLPHDPLCLYTKTKWLFYKKCLRSSSPGTALK